MALPQPRNPLHGINLEQLLVELVEILGWEAMGSAVPIRCFTHDPSIASSLKFLLRTLSGQQQIASLHRTGELRNRDPTPALAAPDT